MTATETIGVKIGTHGEATGIPVDVKTLENATEIFVIMKTLKDEAGTLGTAMNIEDRTGTGTGTTTEDGTGTTVSIARAETPREI